MKPVLTDLMIAYRLHAGEFSPPSSVHPSICPLGTRFRACGLESGPRGASQDPGARVRAWPDSGPRAIVRAQGPESGPRG